MRIILLVILLIKLGKAQENHNDSLRTHFRNFEIISLAGLSYLSHKKESYLMGKYDIKHWRESHLKKFNTRLDDFTQFAPVFIFSGLKILGYDSKDNWNTASLKLASSFALSSILVQSTKYISKELRPDASARNTFPSGHTSTAFLTASFLEEQYAENYPWVKPVAYSFATFTGIARVLNNRHWMSDVFAGAAFGLFSYDASMLLFPIDETRNLSKIAISPYEFQIALAGKKIKFSHSTNLKRLQADKWSELNFSFKYKLKDGLKFGTELAINWSQLKPELLNSQKNFKDQLNFIYFSTATVSAEFKLMKLSRYLDLSILQQLGVSIVPKQELYFNSAENLKSIWLKIQRGFSHVIVTEFPIQIHFPSNKELIVSPQFTWGRLQWTNEVNGEFAFQNDLIQLADESCESIFYSLGFKIAWLL